MWMIKNTKAEIMENFCSLPQSTHAWSVTPSPACASSVRSCLAHMSVCRRARPHALGRAFTVS